MNTSSFYCGRLKGAYKDRPHIEAHRRKIYPIFLRRHDTIPELGRSLATKEIGSRDQGEMHKNILPVDTEPFAVDVM